ncbi:MAG: aminobenzoate oxygenase, partial [Metallosphaera sp.]
MSDIDYLQDPLYPTPNVYPPKWSFDNERAWQLYRRAKREQWDEEDIDWNKIKEIASGLDRKQRLAIAYWWSLLSNFDNATPV